MPDSACAANRSAGPLSHLNSRRSKQVTFCFKESRPRAVETGRCPIQGAGPFSPERDHLTREMGPLPRKRYLGG